MPKEIDKCVQSVLEDNSDMDESSAWAICNAQMNDEKSHSLFEVGTVFYDELNDERAEVTEVTNETITVESGNAKWTEKRDDVLDKIIDGDWTVTQVSKADADTIPDKYLDEMGLDTFTPPETAQENAQKVLEWQNNHDDEIDAMTEDGWRRANQLASGEPMTPDTIDEMNGFSRHEENTEYGNAEDIPSDAEKPWTDNGTVAWLGWGGDAGVSWADEVAEEMDEIDAKLVEEKMSKFDDEGLLRLVSVEDVVSEVHR